jgi:hypothetical protein
MHRYTNENEKETKFVNAHGLRGIPFGAKGRAGKAQIALENFVEN